MNNKGFTLIELLIVIIVLGLITSISIYFGSNAIKNAKEKTYLITVNNIETVANSYMNELSNKLFYIKDENNSEIEYQCITISELIDLGYFTTDILNSEYSEDKKVSLNDYISLKRNVNTKALISTKFIIDEGEFKMCNKARNTKSKIYFNVITNENGSKNISLTCNILNDNCDNYTLMYKIGIDDEYHEYTQEFLVDTNTTIYAKLNELSNSEESIIISDINK